MKTSEMEYSGFPRWRTLSQDQQEPDQENAPRSVAEAIKLEHGKNKYRFRHWKRLSIQDLSASPLILEEKDEPLSVISPEDVRGESRRL
jgi:hypothetical protein